ncbi:SpaA isopeptide-forming pilin-related protein [Bifidobacterium aquikefiricola]|uniref:SpaA isopeptide-forming pilin-related protein n=1 Tax=Bifidobacterium aquikefiricola TaxID=3059038 RepID=A0AB39U8N7_9BIFI
MRDIRVLTAIAHSVKQPHLHAFGAACLALAIVASMLVFPYEESSAAGKLEKIETVMMPSTSMQLFDYWIDKQSSPDNAPASTCAAWKTFLTSGINGPASLNSGGVQGEGLKFAKDLKWPPSGCNLSSYGSNAMNLSAGNSVYQGIVQPALSDSFPKLASYGQASLDYLFNPAVAHEGRANYEVTGANLFKTDGNYLTYNSKENFASYNAETSQFDVYNKPAVQTGSNVGQFFPFNTADQVFTNGEANSISVTDPSINHYFGLGMLSTFTQPLGGVIGSSSGTSDDMVFDFSGDDDMWVFIDGALVLDLGGSHAPASGSVNFKTGAVTVKGATGQVITSSTLQKQYAAAGITPPSGWQGSTFVDGTRHHFSLFYLERGNYQSNLEITTNLNFMPAAHLQKTDIEGTPIATKAGQEASFALYNTQADYSVDGLTPIGTFTTDKDGAITFVDDDTGAQLNFGSYDTDYFVLRETKAPPGYGLLLNDIHLQFIPIKQSDGTVVPGMGTLNVMNYYETGVETSFDSWASPVNSTIYRWCPGLSGSPGYNENTSGVCDDSSQTSFSLDDIRHAIAAGGGLKAMVVRAPTSHNVDFPSAPSQITNPDDSNSWQQTGYHLMNGSSSTGWREISPVTNAAASQYAAVTTDANGVILNSDLLSAKVYDFEPYGSSYRVGTTDLPGLITDYNIPNRTELNFDVLYYLDLGSGNDKILLNYNSFSRQRVSDIIVPNTPEIISVRKVDGHGNPLQNVGFTIFTDKACASEAQPASACGAAQTLTNEVFTDGDGNASFTVNDVLHNTYAYGNYYLRETTSVVGYEPDPYPVTISYSKGGYFVDAGTTDAAANNSAAGDAYTRQTYDPDDLVSVELGVNRIKAPIVGRGQNDVMTDIDGLPNLEGITGKLYQLVDGQIAPNIPEFEYEQWSQQADATGKSAQGLTYDYSADTCAEIVGGVKQTAPCTAPQHSSTNWVESAAGKYVSADANASTFTVDSGYARFGIFPGADSNPPPGWNPMTDGKWVDNEITFGYSIRKTIVVKNLVQPTTLTVKKMVRQFDNTLTEAGGYTFQLYRRADLNAPIGDAPDPADVAIGAPCVTSSDASDLGQCSTIVRDLGTYYWAETGVAAGTLPENVTSAPIHVTTTNAGTTITPMVFTNPRNPGEVNFIKYASNPDNPSDDSLRLQGASFQLWTDAGSSTPGSIRGSCTTNDNGTCSIEDLMPGDYLYRECIAPAGFRYDVDADGCSKFAKVHLDDLGDAITSKTLSVANAAKPTQLTISKISLDDLTKVGGAVYTLYRIVGNLDDDINGETNDIAVGSCTTDDLIGVCSVDAPTLGSYYWRETKAPSGYELNTCVFPNASMIPDGCGAVTPITIDVNSVNQPNQFTVTGSADFQKWSTLSIRKVSNDASSLPLEGAQFALYRLADDDDPAPETANESGNDTLLDSCVTDSSGTCSVGELPFGRYYWAEQVSPEGYEIPKHTTSDVITIGSEEAGTTTEPYIFKNPRNPGTITVTKVRMESDGTLTADALAGAVFAIYEDTDSSKTLNDADKMLDTCTTSGEHTNAPDSYGTCSFKDLNVSQGPNKIRTYFVEETQAPAGYKLAEQVADRIKGPIELSDATPSVAISLGNKPNPSTVSVKKIDADTGESLDGATFALYDASKPINDAAIPVGTCTTSTIAVDDEHRGSCSINVTDFGSYRWKEIAAPQGYQLPAPEDQLSETVTVNAPGEMNHAITFADQQTLTALSIRKSALDSSLSLQGAAFSLYRLNDVSQQPGDAPNPADSKIGDCVTESSGICTISNLGFGAYYWVETQAPDGYVIPKDSTSSVISINASNTGKTFATYQFSDPRPTGRITVVKLARTVSGALDTGKPLTGAVVELYEDSNANNAFDSDTDKKLTECTTSGSEGSCVFKQLAAGVYFAVEVTAPDGYQLPENAVSSPIVLVNNGYDSAGVPITSAVRYQLGDLPKPSSLAVKKISAATAQPLSGAVFELYRSNSNGTSFDANDVTLAGSCTTSSQQQGTCSVNNLQVGHYFWKEITAPLGYDLPNNPISDVVVIASPVFNGLNNPKVFADTEKSTTLRLLKLDAVTGNVLQGAVFELYKAAHPELPVGDQHDEDDSLVGSCTTDASGICEVANLGLGSYFWEETVAPAGHDLDSDSDKTSALVHIVPETAGTQMQAVKFTNPRNPGRIIVNKFVAQPEQPEQPEQPLGGAVIELWMDDGDNEFNDKSDSFISTCTTSPVIGPQQGSCTFEDLKAASTGTRYFIRERSAPMGYDLSGEEKDLVLTENQPVGDAIQFFDAPVKSQLFIRKTDAFRGTALSGAVFALVRDRDANQLYDPEVDTEIVGSCTTLITQSNPTGQCAVTVAAFGTFFWLETQAPQGYAIRDGATATVHVDEASAGGDESILIPSAVNDVPLTSFVKVLKLASHTKQPLSGAEFDLIADINANGTFDDGTDTLINSCISGSDGFCSIQVNDFGHYLFMERKAPVGYTLPDNPVSDAIIVTPDNAGTEHIGNVIFLDDPIPPKPDKPDKPDKPGKPTEPAQPDNPPAGNNPPSDADSSTKGALARTGASIRPVLMLATLSFAAFSVIRVRMKHQ